MLEIEILWKAQLNSFPPAKFPSGEDRVAQIVGTWEPGSEEVETDSGNGRERDKHLSPLS